jgi:pectate lyase
MNYLRGVFPRNVRGHRRAGAAAGRRLLLLTGSCGVVLATSAGCLETPRTAHRTKTGGQSFGGTAGTAGIEGLGGTHAGDAQGGKAGMARAGAGAAGRRSRTNGAGGSGATTSPTGGEAGTTEAGSAGENGGGGGGEANASGGTGAGGHGAGGTTSDAGSGAGGLAGEGGYVEEPFTGPCPDSVVNGWVTVEGLGFDPAASTAAGPEVVVSDAASLVSYATSPDPYVIRISGTIALPVLDVSSNKTIMGDDSLATLEGGIRILGTSIDPADMVQNVVIKNLHIDATTADTSDLPNEDDGISIAYGHHVWIDHVDVWDAPGDDLSVSNGSDYITVSWSKFRFVNGSRRTAARIGNSDANAAEDTDRLKVTFHHDWWTDDIDQRMPRVRFGDVHVFDNYYSNRDKQYPDDTYCVAAGYESRLLVENNFFDEVYNPHVFFSFTNNVSSYSEPTAEMVANGNTYVGVSDTASGKQSGQGSAFVPPYAVTLEPADDVLRNTIRHCAGVQ